MMKKLGKYLASKGSTVISVAAHPGMSNSNLMEGLNNAAVYYASIAFAVLFGQSGEMGSAPLLMAATSPSVVNMDYVGTDFDYSCSLVQFRWPSS